jgi:hypothetical protein
VQQVATNAILIEKRTQNYEGYGKQAFLVSFINKNSMADICSKV